MPWYGVDTGVWVDVDVTDGVGVRDRVALRVRDGVGVRLRVMEMLSLGLRVLVRVDVGLCDAPTLLEEERDGGALADLDPV